MLIGKILWGQFYRYLPVKFATRVLANLSGDRLPTIPEFVNSSLSSATSLRKLLNKIDKRAGNEFGEKISAGFPEMSEKSKRRFENHFLISMRKSASKLDGMLTRLKFANVQTEDGEEFIGLTKQGKEFAVLRNNVLDEAKPPSLSEEEVRFLLDHIFYNLPNEFDHMKTILNLIKTQNKTRDSMNASLRSYYEERFSELWSDAVVNTMRAGSIGRMLEMGLIIRDKKGKNVSYSLTDLGDDVTKRKYKTGNSTDTGGEQDNFSCVQCGRTHGVSEQCAI
jgi:predicted transcriptional regulator